MHLPLLLLAVLISTGLSPLPTPPTPPGDASSATGSAEAAASPAVTGPPEAAVSSAAPDGEDAALQRPVVLLVHGRGLQGADTARLRSAWRDALSRGLHDIAGERPMGVGGFPLVQDADFRLVWYADALRPGAASTCSGDGARTDREEGWARDLATAMETAGTLMGLAADWIGGPEGAALGALAGDLLYLGDERRRCGAEQRLARALDDAAAEGRPVILVTHSFGALVTYHHLLTRGSSEGPFVERWITIGSLLGRPELRRLLLDDPGGRLPPRVGSWVNVYDPRDPFSAPLAGLAGLEGREGQEEEAVEDRRVEAPRAGDPHDPVRYLVDPATARAVLEAWCRSSAGDTAACL